MKTVRLPIYEDEMATGDVLVVDLRHFLGEASSEIAHRYIQVEPKPTPVLEEKITEQEIEVIDRIISGLPVPVVYKSQKVDPDPIHFPEGGVFDIGESIRRQEPVRPLVMEADNDFNEPAGRPYYDWRKIPGLEGYTMNARKIIINESTDKTVGQERGAQGEKVLLSDADGVGRRYSVDFLFKKTFPELNK
jgi:hypothetical protein